MDFIELIKVVVLGIVEGITEWLPISSTGHLILVNQFLKLNASEAFMDMFNYLIQLGAILAVVVLYFKKLWPLTTHYEESNKAAKLHWDKKKLILWLKIIAACIPGAIAAVLFDDLIPDNPFIVGITLIVYGIIFIIIELHNKNRQFKINDVAAITFKTALIIGVFQVLSLIPGTSRSGITIIGAMLIGTSRTAAAEFTFYLAIPVMVGESLLKIVKFIMDGNTIASGEIAYLLVGMLIAFAVSIVVIKFLISFIKKHDFKPFGVYRIILGIIVLIYFGLIV